jgi:hypothetical protein
MKLVFLFISLLSINTFAFDSRSKLRCIHPETNETVTVEIFDNLSNGKPRIADVFAIVTDGSINGVVLLENEFKFNFKGFHNLRDNKLYEYCKEVDFHALGN